MENEKIEIDVNSFVKRLMKINRKASEYEYEELYDSEEQAIDEIKEILDKKLSQWEWELKYDLSKRGQKQYGEDLMNELYKKKPELE